MQKYKFFSLYVSIRVNLSYKSAHLYCPIPIKGAKYKAFSHFQRQKKGKSKKHL